MIPRLAGDGLLVAGDAAALCLAAGIWLEGVNFAIASGMIAGEAATEALARDDVERRGPGGLPAPARGDLRPAGPPQAPAGPDARAGRSGPAAVPAAGVQHRGADVPRRQPRPQAGSDPHRAATSSAGPASGCETWPAMRGPRRGASDDRRTVTGGSAVPPRDRGLAGDLVRGPDGARSIFRRRPEPHIVVDGDACRGCTTRDCVVGVPRQPLRADEPTAGSCSTTSSASSAAPATSSATPRARSPGTTPRVATASSFGGLMARCGSQRA